MRNRKLSFLLDVEFFSQILTLKYIPRWIVLFFDLLFCFIAYALAGYISLKLTNHTLHDTRVLNFELRATIILASQLILFGLFHTYSGVLRYSTYVDAVKLLLAVFSNVFIMLLIIFVAKTYYGEQLYYYWGMPIYGLISFFFLFSVRLVVKTTFDFFNRNTGNVIPVIIYGTKDAGVGIAKMLNHHQTDVKYKLIGFVDDKKEYTQRILMGVRVYYLEDSTVIKKILKKSRAVIISPQKLTEINPSNDLDIFINNNVSILTLPPVSVWNDNLPTIKQIKSVQIEDLLDRPEINISTENIEKHINNRVVLVTGAAGSIGSEIARQVLKYNPRLVVLLDQAESPLHALKLELDEKYPDLNFTIFLGDVRNKQRMEYMMDTYRPEHIYHAAAYKHVPMIEDHAIESIMTNVQGTRILADLAVKYNTHRFVMVSTDKAVNPTNVMGASKRIAEIYVQSLFKKLQQKEGKHTKFITTRFGNVLGSNGSVIPLFKSQIEKGGPITVTHPEIIRYFMTIPEACMLVLEAGVMGNGGEIYIFDMGKPVKIVHLAQKMIRLAGLIPEVDIKIEYTGLRPGEKLYEELLNQKEITTQTHNPKIMIAKVHEYDFDSVSRDIYELIEYSHSCKNFLAVSQMKKIVPEFKSKNSQYESLDA